jgi:histone H3/H4
MAKRRNFSLYDIEEVLKGAGATRVHEKAIISFETELEETVRELVSEAQFYANYAGRSNLITNSDIAMAENGKHTPKIGYGSVRVARIRKSAPAKTHGVTEAKRI